MPARRPLRVLNVVGSMWVGGTERYLSRIVPLLRREHGIDTEIYVLRAAGPLLDVLRTDGVPIRTTEDRRRAGGTPMYAIPLRLRDLVALLRQQHYDIVHSYLFHAEVLGTAAARLARTPRIIISRRALSPWRRPEGPVPYALESLTNLLAHELIANSWTVMRDVERTERFLPSTRGVIYNGVDVAAYESATPRTSGQLRMLTVGALAERKGQEFAIEALRFVRDAGIDAKLVIVGTGPSEGRLREIAGERGVAAQVIFAGLATDPRPFFRDADLFVLPSRQEGFSNALLEAMASGLPCVATDVGGNAEAIVGGVGGIIVPPSDSAALARAIVDLGNRRDSLAEMGITNRRRIEKHFSLTASAAHVAAWYRTPGDGGAPVPPN
jgi:glycosyltransferase involved in cell wall biosynthesis